VGVKISGMSGVKTNVLFKELVCFGFKATQENKNR